MIARLAELWPGWVVLAIIVPLWGFALWLFTVPLNKYRDREEGDLKP